MADYDNCIVKTLDDGRPVITHDESQYKDNGVEHSVFLGTEYEKDYYDYNYYYSIIVNNLYKYMIAMGITDEEMTRQLGFDFSYEEFISKKRIYSESEMIKVAHAIGCDRDKALYNQEIVEDRRWG